MLLHRVPPVLAHWGMRLGTSTMRAVRLHGIGDLRCERIAVPPAIGSGRVRIAVRAAGICGSDLHNFRTGQWISRTPTIPGHEFAGEVLAVGKGVKDFKPGDKVLGDSRVNCGECARCREGRPNVCDHMGFVGEVCDGAFAEIIDLPAQRLLRVPEGVSLSVAALAEPLGVALRVIRRLDPPRATPILITGAGPVGGLAAVLLAHFGFGPLALIERNRARAELVAAITGARLLPADAAELDSFSGAQGLRFAIEATGSDALLGFLLRSLAGAGRLALVGMFTGRPTLDANLIVERELELRGCSVFCTEQSEVLGLLPALAPTLERVISAPIDLESVPAAYERLLSGVAPFLKTIVRP